MPKTVSKWLSKLPEVKKDDKLNEEQCITLINASGHETDLTGYTFSDLVKKFFEERRMDLVKLVVKLAEEEPGTDNFVDTTEESFEGKNRHGGCDEATPMEIGGDETRENCDHIAEDNWQRQRQPTRVPNYMLFQKPEPPQIKKRPNKSEQKNDNSGMQDKYQAHSDDDDSGKTNQQAQTGQAVSQSQPSACKSRLWIWFIVLGCLILVFMQLYVIQILRPKDDSTLLETVVGHSRIMEQLLVIPKMNKLLDDWKSKEDDDNTMSILVTGKTGVGKSTLINGIIGKRVIPVEDNVLKPATEDVEAYDLTIGEVEIKVWDTHGFQEGASGDETKYLEDMKSSCQQVDLVLYCLRMDDTRMRPGDIHGIKQLTATFGKSIWDHALFVLTFANKVEPPKKRDRHKLEEYFNERINSWADMLGRVLKDTGVTMDTEMVRRKVVPAGFEEPSLPGRKSWLSDLWLSAFHESSSHAKPLLLAISNDRLTDEDNGQ